MLQMIIQFIMVQALILALSFLHEGKKVVGGRDVRVLINGFKQLSLCQNKIVQTTIVEGVPKVLVS